jgi:hypothetical protein
MVDLKRLTMRQIKTGVLLICCQIGLISSVITYQWTASILNADKSPGDQQKL